MYAFCVRELENAVICELGNFEAKYRAAEPHPHLRACSQHGSGHVTHAHTLPTNQRDR